MSDRIHQLVDTIREKSISLKDQVASEKAKKQELEQEVQNLKQEVSLKDGKVGELSSKVTELNDDLKTVKEQSITGSEGKGISNDQIDELVKEIEYCIGQLKK